MSAEYIEFVIANSEYPNEVLIALLEDHQVDSFWEDDQLKFYVLKDVVTQAWLEKLNFLAENWQFSFDSKALEKINWNERWESNFQPVEVGEFCRIRASFHPAKEGFQHELIIDPKMAFGTGHHATTYMMVAAMEQLDIKGKSLFDYGTGTGILAILAKRLGAADVFGNDIEEEAVDNAKANEELNHVEGISWRSGDMTIVPQGTFDIVLANINRNVLLETLPDIALRMSDTSVLLMSGILADDEDIMKKKITDTHLFLEEKTQKGDWLMLKCRKAID